jgi:Concanavalin A-like lectin/glucanases superfamily
MYDGSTFNQYVNGALEASLSESKTVAYSSRGWEIGSGTPLYFPDSPDTWIGIVDEVQAFDRALPESEIQSIFKIGSAGSAKTLQSAPEGW